VVVLHVEYAGPGIEYGILFRFSLYCEYIHLDFVRIHVIYRVHQAEYVIHIRVVAPQEYVDIDSTLRVVVCASEAKLGADTGGAVGREYRRG